MPSFCAPLAVFTLVLAGAASAVAAPAAETGDAVAVRRVASDLYTFHMAHDMGFSPETLALRARWLTPDLVALAQAYLARPVPNDEPPVIDGDPFTDAQDTPKRFTVGEVSVSGTEARAEISFSWEGGETTRATLVLRRSREGWLVDDVAYPEGTSMRKLLLAPPE